MTVACASCGAQYASDLPSVCVVCSDERSWQPGRDGQKWLSLDELHKKDKNVLLEEKPRMISIGCTPVFGAMQRALFIQTGDF